MSTATTAAVFDDLSKAVKAELVQRDREVDALILALIAQAHILFLGEPGIAKTLVVERLMTRIEGLVYESEGMGPFTSPEDVFGDRSILALKQDERRFITTGMLPEAHVYVFDEWTRAGKAVIQQLLRAWNERTFKQAGVTTKMPLMTGVFLCNFLIDLKDQQQMAAAYDRIPIRLVSEPVLDAEGLRALDSVDLVDSPPALLTLEQVKAAQAAAKLVTIPDAVTDARIEIFGKLCRAGLRPSTRRYRESLAVLRAAAFLDGCTEATTEHLDALIPVFVQDPENDRRTVEKIVWEVASPGMKEVSELIDRLADVVTEVEGCLAAKTAGTSDANADIETSAISARRKITQYAKKVKRLQGQGDRTDTALADVWRRLQVLHDRIMVEALEMSPITLDAAMSVRSAA